ncbi:DUF1127 domain-containing protein [Jannaschia formosa]|uniref:DUF1127 domain-containing protein n=1 Tax=Jannaschia formosa TaxID=2259592 RepID=UPI000E1B71F3|nr:DUF1127 domain-containing protein [Jannaschia formosa]TFL19905.1 DUF1127 domain-containing protein [Jannaschia formosa]
MANTAYGTSTLTIGALRDRAVSRLDSVRDGWRRWRLYTRTYDELAALSSRELDDLGISRSSIRSIAHEAAYGK